MRIFARALISISLSLFITASSLLATPAKEEPWLPEAAAYRLTLFFGNLSPVPWGAMKDAWKTPYRGSSFARSALQRLSTVSQLDTNPLLQALQSEDRQAVFAESTRLIASRVNEELDSALEAKNPADAKQAIAQARELYRAFADHIRAADPKGGRQLGRAWLELNSKSGSAGILGSGMSNADRDAMALARKTISDYLDANYLVENFSPRRSLNAIPELVFLSGRAVDLPVTLPPGSDIFDQDPLPKLVLNFERLGIDEANLPQVAYGDMLFDSSQIFGSPARELGISCATCHNRSDINQRFFIPGASHQAGSIDVDGAFFNPIFNDYRNDPIDIPSLRGLRFTGPYGRDGRFPSLRDFTRNVIVNEFAGDEPTPFMLDALISYMLEFEFLPNRLLTADGNLTEFASDAARRGELVFNTPFSGLNDRSCASCHVPDSNFLDKRTYDIGSVEPGYEGARSGAMETPTLLGTLSTAPYFHDGRLPTLASVVEWFDTTKSLGLSDANKADLTAYLKTVGAADEPYEVFEGENTKFRLAFDELTTFASTLETLLPHRDAKHILLLTDTVATDLATDASTMVNLSVRPEIYAMSGVT